MGITVSAETPANDTVVYEVSTTGVGTTFYLRKEGNATFKADATTDPDMPSIRYSFDYFVPG